MTEPGPDDAAAAGQDVAPGRHSAATDPAASHVTDLADALGLLRSRLAGLHLPLEAPGAAAARDELRRTVDQLDDYLLPRLRAAGAPLLVVVGGSTGAGKSTLVNSLLGEQVSAPGVLRPTTRSPVLVHHPLDGRWFSTDRVLPGLARVTEHGAPEPVTGTHARADTPAADPEPGLPPARALRLVASEALPPGTALLDAPDVDSVEAANRALAAQLLAAADLWLFVTTAARYADAVPWDLLARGAGRRAEVALVLDRVDPGAEAVVADLRRLLDEHGLAGAPLLVVPETPLVDGYLPETAVAPVAAWLSDLAADPAAREHVVAATRDGVVDDVVHRAGLLATAADGQREADARLREAVARAHEDALVRVEAATSDGALLRGEVLARWQDLVGTSELFRSVEQGVGRVRDALSGFFRGRPRETPRAEAAIAHGLEAVVVDAAQDAAERAYAAWRGDPAGAALLDGLVLSRPAAGVRDEAAEQVRAWQGDVLDLVREQGAGRRGTARALSFGVNGLGVALMVLVFASTGGLTGLEVGIAGGTAVVAQKLLEAVFGDDAVRRLTTQARERLTERVRGVLDRQAARYTSQLDALGAGETGGDALREVARAVEQAARAERTDRAAAAERAAAATTAPGAGGTGLTAAPVRRLRGADALGAAGGAGGAGSPGTPGAGPAPSGAPGSSGSSRPDGAPDDDARPGFWRRLLGGRGSGT